MAKSTQNTALLQEIDYGVKPVTSASWGWVYKEFFDIERPVFSMVPDDDFFYCHANAQEVLNTLFYAVKSGESIVKLIGEAGVGKTLVCHKFFTALDDSFVVVKICNPNINAMTFLKAILDELALPYHASLDGHQLVKYLLSYLSDLHHQRRCHVIVFIDDAQRLEAEVLQIIRVLSNAGKQNKKYIQFILAAQLSLDVILANQNIDDLGQRITFSARLRPLKYKDTQDYIRFRLAQAGCDDLHLFTIQAILMLHKASQGIPRLINLLAHKAMLIAYGEGRKKIGQKHIGYAIADTDSMISKKSYIRRHYPFFLVLMSVFALGALILFRMN